MKPILMMGSAAYSPFRLDALRAALAAADPALANVSIDARWVYAIEPEGEGPDAETLDRAALLLNAVSGAADTNHEPQTTNHFFYVTPRKGTISPWSSKATDIFRNCGLKGIARVERGIRYQISVGGKDFQPFNPSTFQPAPAAQALYDRHDRRRVHGPRRPL